jgi:hypothetical protein
MDWSPFWEATTHCSASKKFLRLLWNPTVHIRLHKSSTCSLSWTIKSTPHFLILLFKINCSIILLSMHSSYKWSLSSTFCYQKPYAFPSSTIMMPLPSHPRGFVNANRFWEQVKITKSLIKQFPSTSCHFRPLASTHTHLCSLFSYAGCQILFFLWCERPCSQPHKKDRQNYLFIYINLIWMVNFTLEQAMKVQRGNRAIGTFFLKLDARCGGCIWVD